MTVTKFVGGSLSSLPTIIVTSHPYNIKIITNLPLLTFLLLFFTKCCHFLKYYLDFIYPNNIKWKRNKALLEFNSFKKHQCSKSKKNETRPKITHLPLRQHYHMIFQTCEETINRKKSYLINKTASPALSLFAPTNILHPVVSKCRFGCPAYKIMEGILDISCKQIL